MPDRFTAVASVTTSSPARYAKQLASHLGRRAAIVEEAEGTRLILDGAGTCLLRAVDGALQLDTGAPTEEGLDRVMSVVASHLERFGQREALSVTWQLR